MADFLDNLTKALAPIEAGARSGLADFLGFLAKPAKGLAAATGIAPDAAPWLQKSIIPPEANYPYGTPKSQVEKEELMKLAQHTGMGVANIGGKAQAITNLLKSKGFHTAPIFAKSMAEAPSASDLWYALPHDIKSKPFEAAARELGIIPKNETFSTTTTLQPGQRFPLIEKAAELAKQKATLPPLEDISIPSAALTETTPAHLSVQLVNKGYSTPQANELLYSWGVAPGSFGKALPKNIVDSLIDKIKKTPPPESEPWWTQKPLEQEKYPSILKPEYQKPKEASPYENVKPITRPFNLSVLSGAHKASEEAARAAGYNIPVFKGMRNFDPTREGLMIDRKSPEPAQFFTRSPNVASEYAGVDPKKLDLAEADWSSPTTLPLWIRALNPLRVGDRNRTTGYSGMRFEEALKKAQAQGHDSVIFRNIDDVGGVSDQFAVFDPSQIRSVHAKFKDWWSPNLLGGRVIPPPPKQEEQ